MVQYLKKIWKLLLLWGICGGVLLVLFFLYELPLEAIFYGGILCTLITLLFLLWGYFSYRGKEKQLRQLLTQIPVGLEKLPEPEDGKETLYQEMVLELDRLRMGAETKRMKLYEEMTDYYTMWVHQIKTPIAAMRLLLQEQPEKNRDELGELFKIEQYVEMVLGYLRAQDMSGDMKFEVQELDEIIKEQIHKYARIFIGKKISLDFSETGEKVITDRKWLGFVLGQLLSNALKYTKKGKISIYMDKTRESTLVVEDTGIGIEASDLPRIFEKGFTGYNGRGEGKSTGIGLYLCAKIVKRLGYRIFVESEQGKGTKVFLDLKTDELELM